jgi:alpha-galactosidase
MPVLYDAERAMFHLYNDRISYVIRICLGRFPEQVYFGKRVSDAHPARASFADDKRPLAVCVGGIDERLSLQHLAQEYPFFGTSDFHYPACSVTQENGSSASSFVYERHEISRGKVSLDPLPSVCAESDAEADSLDLVLRDHVTGVRLVLRYSIFSGYPALTRSALFVNDGLTTVTLDRAMSFSLDLPDHEFEMLQLSGAWARERQVKSRPLTEGVQSIHSLRGTSSAEHNPFIALKRPMATEDSGDVYGFSLVYSGNFLAQAEVDAFASTRVMMGIHPDTFSWPLGPGESFVTPESVLVFSDSGLNGMSQAFHGLYRTRLARGFWRDRDRPVLLNNWEATGVNFTEEKIVKMAQTAKSLGVELFVLDDGWFGARDGDTAGLGDWRANRKKLPDGIAGLAKKIIALGLGFGIWIEPEMVNRDSDLFRAHPDWILRDPNREPSVGRHQFVLDFSRPEVVDCIASMLEDVLRGSGVSYVKWDMNRYLTECWSASASPRGQGTVFHRYVLGVYALYGRLTKGFPEILFESCSSGGARFDPGILAFAPQTWTSDDTDAVERLRIQYGTSFVYPLSSMGNHVSEVPNQQVGRVTPFSFRGNVAFFGQLGYELDPDALSEDEREQVRLQIAQYKNYRSLVRTGTFYRIASPFEGNLTAWIVVSPDQRVAVAACYRVLNSPNQPDSIVRLKGLKSDLRYAVQGFGDTLFFGDELMYAGLRLSPEIWKSSGDFASVLFRLSVPE